MKQPVFLELTEGCYGLQRNGETVGPLRQDHRTGMIDDGNEEWDRWYPTGYFSTNEETPFDILEIIPTPLVP